MKAIRSLLIIGFLLIPILAFAAIDTAKKRMSASMMAPMSKPDGSVNAADRAQMRFVYRGLGSWGASDGGSSSRKRYGNDLGYTTN